MIDEDRLLNRIDILENKLQFLQKHASEDRLKEEIMKLQEDKSVYQNSAKEALRKVYQERMDAMQKLSTIQRALCNGEDECSLLRDQLLRTQQNLQEVNCRLTRFEAECKEHRENNEKTQTQVQKQDLESQNNFVLNSMRNPQLKVETLSKNSKFKEGAADTMNAICNEADTSEEEKCLMDISKINEKLSNVEE